MDEGSEPEGLDVYPGWRPLPRQNSEESLPSTDAVDASAETSSADGKPPSGCGEEDSTAGAELPEVPCEPASPVQWPRRLAHEGGLGEGTGVDGVELQSKEQMAKENERLTR